MCATVAMFSYRRRVYCAALLTWTLSSSQPADGSTGLQGSESGICVRLLRIDRREGTQQALDTVELAAQHMHRGVVGIDLSGNPSIGALDTWLPALKLARQRGLKLTLHAAEVITYLSAL